MITYIHVHIKSNPSLPSSIYSSQVSLEDLMDGTATSSLSIYDEAALCSNAFKSVNHIINHHYIMLPSTCVGYSED